MKFVVDAQLPKVLADTLRGIGFDVIHTLDLPGGNRTSDQEIADLADAEGRIVVSKDSDFLEGLILGKGPKRLLLVSTGNIPNRELLPLIKRNMEAIVIAFETVDLVEVTRDCLIAR